MSYLKQEDTMADFTQFFNMDQAASASQSQNGKTTVAPPQFTTPGPEIAFMPPQHVSQQFQGPSHNYEQFRQHSSMPPGAMQAMQHRNRQMMSQNFQGTGSNSLYDINEADHSASMEMDFGDFLATGNSPFDGIVDPNSVGGSEMGDASPVAVSAARVYPGSHQEAARAQQQRLQEQQQQNLNQRQQQQQQQQQQLGHQRRTSQGRNKSVDPAVEEQISQILKRMRADTQASRPAPSATPQPSHNQSSKSKKDEEDMDEDERLLASEEGKKLSSKERRQLRNKVSARAFRSRRKEYISQLEGEINGKNTENDDLRYDNDMLRTENNQLTDLVRMLLGHPAFGSVLEDLSSRGSQMPFIPSQSQSTQQSQQSQQAQQAQQPTQHRGSVAMSQTSTQGSGSQSAAMDFSNTPIDGWNSGLSAPEFNFNANPNVFCVTEMPQHPTIEPEVLSGKSDQISPVLPSLPRFDEKETNPVIERLQPKADYPAINSTVETSDDLYAAQSESASGPAESTSSEPEYQIFGSIPFEKATARYELVSAEEAAKSHALMDARFSALCERLDAVSERISRITGMP